MQGVLYFPMIAVPESSWLLPALLYWDAVGAIIPEAYLREPERLTEQTRELLVSELVLNAYPASAHQAFAGAFLDHLHALGPAELQRRQRAFAAGKVTRLHAEKLLEPVIPSELFRTGLADSRPDSEWVAVEASTAREWMSALALGLCHPDSRWTHHFRAERTIDRWVPATDRPGALDALLTGFGPAEPRDAVARRLRMRVNGEIKVSTLRTLVLADLLPVPDGPVPVDAVVRFRRRHGALLPQLRQHLEQRLEEVLLVPDEDIRMRRLDRIVDDGRERIEQATAYLREAGLRRLTRSTLLSLVKLVPGVAGPVDAARDLAGAVQTQSGFEAEPLAYLAFAHERFAPRPEYAVDPHTGTPLAARVETMTGVGFANPDDDEDYDDDDEDADEGY